MGIRYATKIELKSSIPQVIAVVRKWISTNLDSRFDTEYKNLYYLDEEMESGGRIVGVSAWEAEGGYPISVSLSVDVPDALDHGKYVETQIGMKLLSSGNTLVTIIEDKEDSLQELFINNTLKRPKIVGMLAHSCLPVDSTPGIYICHIGARDCESKIMSDIREKRIVSPVVVVSSTEDGKLLVDQKRLANQLISIADVIVQDPGLDRSVFGKLGAANGGINILWPPDGRDDIQVKRIFPEQLLSYDDPCAAILSAIAERTTWSALKSHIDASYVDKQRGIQRRNIPKKELDEFKRRRVDEIQRRQLTFGAKRPFGKDSKPENTKCKGPRTNNDKNKRSAISRVVKTEDELTPVEILKTIQEMYPDRIVILPSAWKSAQASADFVYRQSLRVIMEKFISEYWEALAYKHGDLDGREILGDHLATNEGLAENSKKSRDLRTFDYSGRKVYMNRHLKIGDNRRAKNRTFRVYFTWDYVNQVIVVGHAGAHLNFV